MNVQALLLRGLTLPLASTV